MNTLDNTLDIRGVFAVYGERVEFSRLESDRLLWLAECGFSQAERLRTIFRTQLMPILNGGPTLIQDAAHMFEETCDQLQQQLLSEFSIACKVRVHLVLEEQEKEGLGRLGDRLGFADGDNVCLYVEDLKTAGLESLTCKNVDEVAWSIAATLEPQEFNLDTTEVSLIPGKEVIFDLTCKKPVICREIRLLCGDQEVLRHHTAVHMDAEIRQTVRVPGIPVKMFICPLQRNSEGLISIQLILAGREGPVTLEQKLHHAPIALSAPPLALFMDIGSAMSKFMTVAIGSEPAGHLLLEDSLAQLKEALRSAVEGDHGHVLLGPPENSVTFSERHGLSGSSKKELDGYDEIQLTAHFACSLTALASLYYQREGRLITDVFWAFPNTQKRNFADITGRVNQALGGSILGRASIEPEAECLQGQFADTFRTLRRIAREQVDEIKQIETHNKNADESKKRIADRWEEWDRQWSVTKFIKKILSISEPQHPNSYHPEKRNVPTLEKWHEVFSEMQCDEELRHFLVFDAGGYSLDVFGSFPDRQESIVESYAAGSNLITQMLMKELLKTQPSLSGLESEEIAEKLKVEICGDIERYKGHNTYEVCRSATYAVYEGVIPGVLERVKDSMAGRGFPILITGGGGNNQFLKDLIRDVVQRLGIQSMPVSSPMLYRTMKQFHKAESTELKAFLCMASGFRNDDETPMLAPHTDILGGLVQIAFKK